MLILSHTLAFLLGFVAATALARYVAARYVARPPRPLSRRRLAIRRANADRLPAHDVDWVAQVNAILDQE